MFKKHRFSDDDVSRLDSARLLQCITTRVRHYGERNARPFRALYCIPSSNVHVFFGPTRPLRSCYTKTSLIHDQVIVGAFSTRKSVHSDRTIDSGAFSTSKYTTERREFGEKVGC